MLRCSLFSAKIVQILEISIYGSNFYFHNHMFTDEKWQNCQKISVKEPYSIGIALYLQTKSGKIAKKFQWRSKICILR